MATKAVDEYKNEITTLKDNLTALQCSKIKQMENFTKEIDHLRDIIKRISGIKHNYNGFVMNHINDEIDLKIPPSSSIVSPVTDTTSKNITSPEMDVRENLPLSPISAIKFSQTKPITHRSRFNTDDGHESLEQNFAQAIGTHHDIIVEQRQRLDEFKGLKLFGVVECKCEQSKPLQFLFTMDEDEHEMKCENCHNSYSSIFKCDSCSMSICSECQKYIAEIQCLKSVMQNFKYPRDFQRELESANTPRQLDHEYNDSIYSGFHYNYNYADESHSLMDDKLIKLESKLRINAGYKLEDIFQDGVMYIDDDRAACSEICYVLIDYLDEIDWCCMLQTKWCLQLLELYWQMYQYHICYQHEWGKWKKLRLLFSTPWRDTDVVTIKERILKHVAKEYIHDYYIPTINENQLIKPKLLYDEDDNPINAEDKPKNVLFYSVDEEQNRHFGNKVIRLLRIIIDNEEYNGSMITFERLKHKQYGKHNDVLADGIFYIWHCYGIKRSFALEEQLFSSFDEAMKEEEVEPEYREEPYMNTNNNRYRAPSYQAPVIEEYETDRNETYDPDPLTSANKFTYDTKMDDASSSHSDYGMVQFDPNENDF